LLKAVSEQTQLIPRLPACQEIRHHLAHDTGKLEPVTRTWTDNPHPRMLRMPIDEEMAVRRVGVHAHGAGANRTVPIRNEPPADRPHRCHIRCPDVAVDGIRIDLIPFVMARDLHAAAEIGKAVKKPPRFVLPDVNWTAVRLKRHRMLRLEPELDLAFDGPG